MPTIVQRWCAGLLLALLSLSAVAGSTLSFTFHAKTYPGSRDRQYKVYVPSGLSSPAPMVMALHGCQQTQDDVLQDWGLTAAADRFHFILVAPFITSYDGLRNTNCWGFWFDAHRHQGAGEPEDLHQIAIEVEGRLSVDPARRYITGLSSGAAMSVVAATTHNEYWAATASGSGLPYGEDAASVSFSGCPGAATYHAVSRVVTDMKAELNDGYAIPLMVLQNNQDCTVVQPAGRNIRDAHLKVFGDATHNTPTTTQTSQTPCTPAFSQDYNCKHVFYAADGQSNSRSIVETVFYDGPAATPNPSDTDRGHYWIGGANGTNGKWSIQNGPSYPDIIWDFFARHPRATSTQPRLTLVGANPLRVSPGQTFTDPGATATDAQGTSLAVNADCSSVNTTQVGQYTCTYRATDGAGHTASTSRTVLVAAANGCSMATSSPAAHISANRATAGGWFGLRALASGDGQDIGFAWSFWSNVTLHEGAPGKWYVSTPDGCPQ